MTTAERSFTDTNILIYAVTPSAPQYQVSRALLESDATLCASAQVFAEFYAVITNPRRVTIPFTPAEARTFIAEVLPRFEILPMPGALIPRWTSMAEQHGVTGHDVFDIQLVATMLESNVRRLYTFNRQDFEHFSGLLNIITP